MPEQKFEIDFRSGQQSSNEPLGGAIPRMVNVLVDNTGAIKLRPGISVWGDFAKTPNYVASNSVDAIALWSGYPVYVTSDRQIHVQLAGGYGVDLSSTVTPTSMLDGGTRPVLATTRVRVIAAGGGAIQKWDGIGQMSDRLGGGPPAASHVVKTNEQVLVNPVGGSGQLQWSDFGDGGEESWAPATGSNAGTLTLAANPDPLVAIYENTGEIIGFGSRSVQVLDPDPSTTPQGVPVVWTPARAWTNGTVAPYSFAQNDEQFGFLDTLRRIQLSNGRSFQSISGPIAATLRSLPEVSDCWGFRAAIGSWDLLGWNFPTGGRTFVYDSTRWVEWAGWSKGNWAALGLHSHCFWPEENLHLVGLGDGTIGLLNPDVTSDNGVPIVAEVISGFQDGGSDSWKTHIATRFYFRRGIGVAGAPRGPRCQLWWRDGTGAWEGPEELELGDPTDPTPVLEVRGLGVYRIRQWRLRMSDGVPLTLVRVIETTELGDQ